MFSLKISLEITEVAWVLSTVEDVHLEQRFSWTGVFVRFDVISEGHVGPVSAPDHISDL